MEAAGKSLEQAPLHDEPALVGGPASSSVVIRLDPAGVLHPSWLHRRRTHRSNIVFHPRLRHSLLLLRPQRPKVPATSVRPRRQHNLLGSDQLPASQRQ